MVKRIYVNLIILSICGVLGLILANIEGNFEKDINILYSWILLGLWICITNRIIRLTKYYREFNSQHNNAFLILGVISIGFIYSYWGNYTGILGENFFEQSNLFELFGKPSKSLFMSSWTAIFALPYILYGILLLNRCYRKYFVVYIKKKPINARKFGFFVSIIISVFEVLFLLNYFEIIHYLDLPLEQVHNNINYPILITGAINIAFMVYGTIHRKKSISEMANLIPAQRMNSRIRASNTATNVAISSIQIPSTNIVARQHRRRERVKEDKNIKRKSTHKRRRKPTQKRSNPPNKSTHKKKNQTSFVKYRPKSSILALEDFKCIFCFQTPKRGDNDIVLCPKCKHPAHIHEFREWSTNSPLCSRCDAQIPSNFRRNPEKITVKKYLEVMTYYLKKK